MIALTPPEIMRLIDWVRDHRLKKGIAVPILIWGEKGLGKTATVTQYAADRGYGLRVYQPAHDHSGREALGESFIDAETGRTRYAVPQFLPTRTEVEVFSPNGVLLIDEINRATPQVLAGLLELIGEGAISQSGYAIPEGWQIVCTANPEGDEYDVSHLDPALIDRMVHVQATWEIDGWIDWAHDAGLEEDVIRFARSHTDRVVPAARDLIAPLGKTPTPRSLELFATLYRPGMEARLLEAVAKGILGIDAAQAFLAERTGSERALTGEEIIGGQWRRYFPGFSAPTLHASLAALLDLLPHRAHDYDTEIELRAMLGTLSDDLRTRFLGHLESRSPEWSMRLGAHAGP